MIRLILLFIFGFGILDAQSIPKGFKASESVSGTKMSVEFDFDEDGKKDIFAVVEGKPEDELLIIASLSSLPSSKVLKHKALNGDFMCCNEIELKKNVVKVFSRGNRFFEYILFRYNTELKDFEIIGFDTESLGSATHDGAGKTSYNLLTGKFISQHDSYNEKKKKLIPGKEIKKSINVPKKFTLSTLDEFIKFKQEKLNF